MVEKNLTEKDSELKSGLTWRTVIALVAAVFFFIPVNIYSYFLTGVIQGTVAVFFITIVFNELSKISGKALSRQEVLVLYYAASWGGLAMPIYYNIIFRSYFVNSPFVNFYTIAGRPMKDYIPSWLVPPPGSPAHQARTLFHPEFLLPLGVWFVWSILVLISSVALSIISANVYVEKLDYTFPMALVDTSFSGFLAERPREATKYFLMPFLIGITFGALAYLPFSIGTALITIPFYDLTWAVEEVLPGGLFGILTVLSIYFGGLVMPFQHGFYILVSSVVIWIILNSLFVTTFPNVVPEWAREYSKGMGLMAVQFRSYLRVWFGPQIGWVAAIALFLIIFKTRKALVRVFKEVLSPAGLESSMGSRTMRGLPTPRRSLLMWLASALASIVYFHLFVPEVNILVPIVYVFAFGFFMMIAITAFQAETGYRPAGFPGWTWHTLVYLTPYQGYSGFIFQAPLVDANAPPRFSQQIKAASILKVKPRDLLIVWILGALLAQLSGLISIDIFWRIAPIPSSAYPFTVYSALNTGYIDAMITGRQLKISLETVLIPALILFVILAVGDFLHTKFGLFFSFIGVTMGLYMYPPWALATFVGSAIGHFFGPRFLGGREKWNQLKGYIVAGELSGEGLIIMLSVVIGLIAKSSWLWPW